jgi:hypothetical protein
MLIDQVSDRFFIFIFTLRLEVTKYLLQIDKDSLGAKINFAGAAIGNGCWGNTVGTCAFSSPESLQISADFYFGHGMYSQELRTEMLSACGSFSSLTPKCLAKIAAMEVQIGTFDGENCVRFTGKIPSILFSTVMFVSVQYLRCLRQ